MPHILQELVGRRVVNTKIVEDYLQVWFENGPCLNVYNKHRITAPDGRSQSYGDLAGATLDAAVRDREVIRLTFSNGFKLSIDMSEDGYLGPEAMQLTRPGLRTVVWRPGD